MAIGNKKKTEYLSFRITRRKKEQLKALAAEMEISVAELIDGLIDQKLAEKSG